jgi:S-adenosylmethionine-diacylglycerol 3-amino-3-carboxypropyl transferase
MEKWKNKIYYSQCWEDPYILLEGLDVQKEDRIISITSGGCNTLTLLLKNPKEVVSLDVNPAQNYLLELKILAIKHLSYEDLMAFLGINYCEDRIKLYALIEQHLSHSARVWWKENSNLIKKGIIHCGKLERYFRFFGKIIIPLIHSDKTVRSLFIKRTKEDQANFYNKTWNTWRWRLFFRIFFSKKITSLAGRNPKLFEYIQTDNISQYYLNKTRKVISSDPSNNFFLYYILVGNYDKDHLPFYLEKENISLIKARVDRIQIISEDIETFFKKNAVYYTKFNLSNIFETCSVELTDNIFKDIVSHSTHDARLVYINHLVKRTFPQHLIGKIAHDSKKENTLINKNMAFFYEKIHIDYIN